MAIMVAVALSVFVLLPGLQQQGIFRVPGSQVEVNDIKNSFERGESDATAALLLRREAAGFPHADGGF